MSAVVTPCPLCQSAGETVLWCDAALRVIDASTESYPGFTRVIWHAHVREMKCGYMYVLKVEKIRNV